MNVQAGMTESRGFCMRLYEASKALRAAGMRVSVQGDDVLLDGVSTDTRSLQKGELFIALSGPNFDGNAFAEQALRSAAACLLERDMGVTPALIVDDSRRALGLLAQAWRQRFSLPLVAITGSNGKTTVKEMLASIFAQQGRVLATHGNLNNDIGMPLTLLRLDQSYDYAVIEMGANHAGEIAYLSQLAAPDVALITNAATAHIAGFGSLEGVARAKGEIYAGLKAGGCALINADDAFAPLWRKIIAKNKTQNLRRLEFGIRAQAEVQASWPATDGRVNINTPTGKFDLRLPLPGRHNLMNALAATAVAIAAGIDITVIRSGLESIQAVPGRLQLKAGLAGSHILDDSYNANPASMKAALDVLHDFSGRHFLALGDMGELGEDEKALHAQAGEQARASGVQRLYSLGSLSRMAATAFGDGAHSFASHSSMIERLRKDLAADVTLLVKGSRRMQMDRIVDALSVDGGKR